MTFTFGVFYNNFLRDKPWGTVIVCPRHAAGKLRETRKSLPKDGGWAGKRWAATVVW